VIPNPKYFIAFYDVKNCNFDISIQYTTFLAYYIQYLYPEYCLLGILCLILPRYVEDLVSVPCPHSPDLTEGA
jgi:hypothetical protein